MNRMEENLNAIVQTHHRRGHRFVLSKNEDEGNRSVDRRLASLLRRVRSFDDRFQSRRQLTSGRGDRTARRRTFVHWIRRFARRIAAVRDVITSRLAAGRGRR